MSTHEENIVSCSPTTTTLNQDWKLNPNTQCRITLEKLNATTLITEFRREPEENIRNRTARGSSSVLQPNRSKPFSDRAYLNVTFVLEAILPVVLGKCEKKCEVCVEYVQKLEKHVIQAHGHGHNYDFSKFKGEKYARIYYDALEFTRYSDTDSEESESESEIIPVRDSHSEDTFASNNSDAENVSNTEYSSHAILTNEDNDQDHESSDEVVKPESMLEHMNFFMIDNNLKEEPVDIDMDIESQEDPLLIPFSNLENNFDLTENNIMNDQSNLSIELPTPETIIKFEIEEEQVDTVPPTINKIYPCGSCEKICHSSHALSTHNKVHTWKELHKCGICGMCFHDNYSLQVHKLQHNVDAGKQLHKCAVCDEGFVSYYRLTQHKLKHMGERIQNRCEICGKCFPYKSGLKRHRLLHSAQRRRYKCDQCERSYAELNKLTKHRLEHAGVELPFTCEICGKGFHYLSPLLLHKRKHLRPSSYKCGVCGYCVKTPAGLSSHMSTHKK